MRVLERGKREVAYELWVMNPDGSGKRRLARSRWAGDAALAGTGASWSPDGRKLVFTMNLRRGNDEIYDGSGLRRLTSNDAPDRDARWSPDGRKIAFVSSRDRTGVDVFVMNADGSDQHLTRKPGADSAPQWSPDGRSILFTGVPRGQPLVVGGAISASGPNPDVYVMNADASGQRNLTHTTQTGEFGAAWSPDGQRIVFDESHGTWARVVVMNADGSGKRAVTHRLADAFMSWSPDGRRIAFWDDGAVYAVSAEGHGQRRLAQNASFDVLSWSPDGRKLAVIRLDHPKKLRPATGTPPRPRPPAADLYVVNADGSGERNLTRTPNTSDGWGATWSRSQSSQPPAKLPGP